MVRALALKMFIRWFILGMPKSDCIGKLSLGHTGFRSPVNPGLAEAAHPGLVYGALKGLELEVAVGDGSIYVSK